MLNTGDLKRRILIRWKAIPEDQREARLHDFVLDMKHVEGLTTIGGRDYYRVIVAWVRD